MKGCEGVWTITLRDLQFRRRQFAIAVVGAGLAFALALVLTGMSAGFRHEARATVDAIDADAWIVPRGVTGPFTSQSTFPADLSRRVSAEQVEPLAEFGHVVLLPDGEGVNANVIGHSIGQLGDPDWERDAASVPSGQAVVDARLGVEEDETVTVGPRSLRVAEVVSNRTYFAGMPSLYVSLEEAQAIAFGGQPVATTIVTRGEPTRMPPGFTALTNEEVREDVLQPLDGAITSIDLTRLLTWLLAVVVIGAVTYLSALERLRDFAVLKAVGSSQRTLVLSLTAQAVLASLVAALLGALVAQALKPTFPLPIVIEADAYVALPLFAFVAGIVASLAAVRRAMRVDPALAFSGA
jgi:putative ABC transport system permease protein